MIPFLWPPTYLTGLTVFVATTAIGLVYVQYRKRKTLKGCAVLKIHWESFLLRSFATAISVSSVLVQASSFQPFSPLQEAGIGQLYITLGILISLGILVSNLKQKLDSFVLPSRETERTRTPPSAVTKPTDELLSPLRNFITRWEPLLKRESRESDRPSFTMRLWEERTRKVMEMRLTGSEAMKYVDGLARLLLSRSAPATPEIATAATLVQRKNYSEAEAKAIEVIEGSEKLEAALLMGQAYLIRGDVASNSGLLSEAEKFYELSHDFASRINDESLMIASALGMGISKGNQGKNIEALKIFEQILDKDPDNVTASRNRGIALFRFGKYEEALATFERAIELDPRDMGARLCRGRTLVKLQQLERAMNVFNEIIAIDPRNADAWLSKASAFFKFGNHTMALAAIDKVTELNPEDADAWFIKGMLHGVLNDRKQQLAALENALRLNPRDVGALIGKAIVLDELGRHREALAACEAAIELDPKYPFVWDIKGIVLTQLNRYDEAIEAIDRALKMKPDDRNLKLLKNHLETGEIGSKRQQKKCLS